MATIVVWFSSRWGVARGARQVRLLAMLHLGFLWAGLAFALYAIDSLARFAGLDWSAGQAPLHALGIGFFASMLITNDVALITFVPLAVMLLAQARQLKLLIPVIVLQTVAANLGSMLTPLGNPQNLYLFAISGMSAGQFLRVMAMPTASSFVLLAGSVFLMRPEPVAPSEKAAAQSSGLAATIPWVVLFLACLLAVR